MKNLQQSFFEFYRSTISNNLQNEFQYVCYHMLIAVEILEKFLNIEVEMIANEINTSFCNVSFY